MGSSRISRVFPRRRDLHDRMARESGRIVAACRSRDRARYRRASVAIVAIVASVASVASVGIAGTTALHAGGLDGAR